MSKDKQVKTEINQIGVSARKNEDSCEDEYSSIATIDGKDDWPSERGDTLMESFSYGCMDLIENWIEKTCNTPSEKREAYLAWYELLDKQAANIRRKATENEGWSNFADSQELLSSIRDIREHLLGSRY